MDDNVLFRHTLRDFLAQETDFDIVGEAGNLSEAIRCIGKLSPHLVLTDLTMPDASGVEAVVEIRRVYPKVKILVISSHRECEYKLPCHAAGASGYVAKESVYGALRGAIRAILNCGTHPGADDWNAAAAA